MQPYLRETTERPHFWWMEQSFRTGFPVAENFQLQVLICTYLAVSHLLELSALLHRKSAKSKSGKCYGDPLKV